jgi:hypothetical protein
MQDGSTNFALDLGDTAATSSGLELIALAAFVGITVFCALQALIAPRRTFCSQEIKAT